MLSTVRHPLKNEQNNNNNNNFKWPIETCAQ